MKDKRILRPDQLKQACDPEIFTFDDTSQVTPLDTVIGQKRAVQAIDFGLNMQCPGYNIFVTGLEGTGKTTIIKDIVSQYAGSLPEPNDWCMVNNFKDVYRPTPIALPPGKAPVFSKQMRKLVNDLKKELPKAFESDSFNDRQKEIQKSHTEKTREMFEKLDGVAAEQQIKIVRTKSGIETVPLVEGQPISSEIFQKLSEEQRQEIESKMETIRAEVDTTFREANKVNQSMSSAMDKWAEKVSLFVVKHRIDLLRDEYAQVPDVLTYLDEVQGDIIENVNSFLPSSGEPTGMESLLGKSQEPSFRQYSVNVLADNRTTKGAPVIFEANPTYFNVFGRIEKRAYMGTLNTDFSLVQAGSLLEANGGYLIMEIESVLLNPFVWETLKRALRNKQLIIDDPASESSHGSSSLRPEPIPLEVKVILLGNYDLFQKLQTYDSKFNKIFKVRADFDHEVKRSAQTEQDYAHFIARVCKEKRPAPFPRPGGGRHG